MKLSIVIPARNEEGNIQKTITGLRDHLDSVGISNLEILVVDDGSTDRTYELTMNENAQDERIRVVRNTGRNGYGRAVSTGLNHFTGDAVVIYMADASDAPQDVAKYYAILRDEADCAFGSRFMRGSKVYDYPKFKLVINRIANFVIRLMFNMYYNDTTNAFKGYRANVIEGCRPFVSPHFNLTIELPLKAIVRGYSYKTMPISWRNRDVGVSALKLKEQGSRYLYTLLTVWFEWLLVRHDTYRTDSGEFEPWVSPTSHSNTFKDAANPHPPPPSPAGTSAGRPLHGEGEKSRVLPSARNSPLLKLSESSSPPLPGCAGGRAERNQVRERVLVTGGAGFIGSHIVDLLTARGFEVIALDNENTGNRADVNPDAEFVFGDVRNAADLAPIFERGVDVVMHIAGQASIRLSFQDPAADLSVNTLGTINVLQQCVTHRVPRLIFASSMTIYGNNPAIPTSEAMSPNPGSYYAITKYAAERYVHATAQRRDLGFDFQVTSMRMFNVYGVRQSLTNAYQGVFAIFIGNVLRGEPINIHSDGEQSRDFVHVSDVARAWVDAIHHAPSYGQVINLGTGSALTVNTLCDVVLKAFGHSRETYPVIYHPAQPGDMRQSAADISRATSMLGWTPQVDWQQGMAETIAWARGR